MIRTIMLEEKDIQCESENPCLLQLCMWASWFSQKIRMILLKLCWWFHVYLDRLANFVVTVSDQRWPITQGQLGGPEFYRCGQYHGTPPAGATVSVTCSAGGILGRYVYNDWQFYDNMRGRDCRWWVKIALLFYIVYSLTAFSRVSTPKNSHNSTLQKSHWTYKIKFTKTSWIQIRNISFRIEIVPEQDVLSF